MYVNGVIFNIFTCTLHILRGCTYSVPYLFHILKGCTTQDVLSPCKLVSGGREVRTRNDSFEVSVPCDCLLHMDCKYIWCYNAFLALNVCNVGFKYRHKSEYLMAIHVCHWVLS